MPVLFLLGLLFSSPSFAADPNKAHPHTGVATPFLHPKKAPLTTAETTQLKNGTPVRKQAKKGDGGGRGIVIMDVKASEADVWRVITNFGKYPKWIDELDTCEIYKKQGDKIYARFVLKAMMMSVEYYIAHHYQPQKGYMTWTLDYSRESDIHDSTGYWLVYPSPDHEGHSRVEYSVDLRVKGLPGFIEDILADRGLEDATKWVKKQAEK